jgi:protein-S-isoprenylcysteine O-methyltransferase Ste14
MDVALQQEIVREGNWLFRWRSFLPLILLAFVLIVMGEYQYLAGHGALDLVWGISCILLSTVGLGIRVFTAGYAPATTSGRNTQGQEAGVLSTTGVYSIVRHPLYLGNFIMWLGMSMFPHIWWVAVIFVLAFWLYYERIMCAEESFLHEKFGASFVEWAERTPPFIPNVRLWKAPGLPFSIRTALRREYNGFFAMVATFFLLEMRGDFAVTGEFQVDTWWVVLLAASFMIWIVLRTLKKRTAILDVEGR